MGSIHIVFRHGCRGPSYGAMKPFEGTVVESAWSPCDMEKVSPRGLMQCESLGRHIARSLERERKVTWYSSKVDRVLKSGLAFLQGFHKEGIHAASIQEGPSIIDEQDPDVYYRAYLANEEYVKASKELRMGKVFVGKAREEESLLNILQPCMTDTTCLVQRLDVTTYFEELLECERYGDRSVLLELNRDHHDKIGELARWCWNERFFRLHESQLLGAPMRQLIRDSDKKSNGEVFVHSAHDYTILSLLKSLDVNEYPDFTIGYCSYMIFDENGVHFNPLPFPNPEVTETVDTTRQVTLCKSYH